MPNIHHEIAIVTAETIQDKIYLIRGQQVMLATDLAEIYGYEHKAFNRQVSNNIERFTDDFRFQLTKEETDYLRCNFYAANISTMSRTLPYVFTEQGIYMLMTILKGDLAVQQSIALIRLFKQMKDFVVDSRALSDEGSVTPLAVQTSENTRAIGELKAGLAETQETLGNFMASFGEGAPFGREYLIRDGMVLEADAAYCDIYGLAERSVYVIDNYIGTKTLLHLRHVRPSADVTVFSDNLGKGLSKTELADFRKEYPEVSISFKKTGGVFHDRFIVVDYGTSGERLFICGASSKDAGLRTTVIIESTLPELYRGMLEELLSNPILVLK